MRDSNMLHAICQDTYPPIFYLNETSHALINFVTQFNQVSKEITLAYTFDAGMVLELFGVFLVRTFLRTADCRSDGPTQENTISLWSQD